MSPPRDPVAAFDRAADYDTHAGVQRQVALGLRERIAALPLPQHPHVLEVGCGTGFLAEALLPRLPGARWTVTDIAPAMLARARARLEGRGDFTFARMDGEQPDQAGCFDLICSSLAFQWFADLPGAVARLRALLAPGGQLAFTTLVDGSFAEWRAAHEGLPCGVQLYPAPETLEKLGLSVTVEWIATRFDSASAFLHHLKGIGAGVPSPGHRPLTPGQLRRVMARFEAGGGVASYVVATCTGGR